jgi:hypothetical protein
MDSCNGAEHTLPDKLAVHYQAASSVAVSQNVEQTV